MTNDLNILFWEISIQTILNWTVVVITVFKAGSYSDHESNICAKMHLNSILLNKLPLM